MMHMSISQWTKYVNNELQDEEREVYENHLYSCDQCLEVYLQVLAENEEKLPSLPTDPSFVDDIIAKIEDNTLRSTRKSNITENKIVKMPNKTEAQIIEIDKHTQKQHEDQPESYKEINKPVGGTETDFKPTRDKVVSLEKTQKKSFYESTMFHYVVAAAMTLILMVSGVFSTMTNLADSIEQSKQIEAPSFTEGLLNKTLSIMDGIDEKLNEDSQLKNKQKQHLKEVEK